MATTIWPKTLQEAVHYFGDPDVCLKAAIEFRWQGNPVTCPTCGSKDVHFIETRRIWRCKGDHSQKQFSVKVGTILEDSPLPLDKWMVAIWLIANAKNGISSYELHRAIGITQKSAWFMLHRIRLAMQSESGGKLGGDVEVDETYIGGKARNMHKASVRASCKGARAVAPARSPSWDCSSDHRQGESRASELRVVPHNDMQRAACPSSVSTSSPRRDVYTDALGVLPEPLAGRTTCTRSSTTPSTTSTGRSTPTAWRTSGRCSSARSTAPTCRLSRSTCSATLTNRRSASTIANMKDTERFVNAARSIVGRRVTYRALTGKDMPESLAN